MALTISLRHSFNSLALLFVLEVACSEVRRQEPEPRGTSPDVDGLSPVQEVSGGSGGDRGRAVTTATQSGWSGGGSRITDGDQAASGKAPGPASNGAGGIAGGRVSGSDSPNTSSVGGATPGATENGTTSIAANCGSHKWACWRMPNPLNSGLPNPSSYSVKEDVIHDNVTGLDWQREPSDGAVSVTESQTTCGDLALGGFDDWRVPTRIEIISLIDWTRSPATDAVFGDASGFHKTGSNWVLTATQEGAGKGTDYAWGANMSDGIVSCADSGARPERVRCVRGGGAGEGFSDKAVAPPNQYELLSEDEAKDNYTGLIWQRDGGGSGLLSWEEAVSYCESLGLGGHSGWRLPSVRELSTLVDESRVAPAINREVFPNTKYGAKSNNWYWASHRARNSTTAAWGINFDDGFTGFNAGASGKWNYWTAAYVKCVRD